jgi:hypothetical protein
VITQGEMMQAYVPIAVYKLPGDQYWLAQALGLEGPLTDGRTQAEAKKNLALVLGHYLDLLNPDDPLQAIELEWLNTFTAPPKGVDWVVVDLSPEAKAARAKFTVPVKPQKKVAKPRSGRRASSRTRKAHARPASHR